MYEPPQPAQQSLTAATAPTPSPANAPTSPSLPPAQYLHPGTANTDPNMQLHMDQPTYDPCLPQNKTSTKVEQNELHKAKSMAKERKQPMASFNLPFAAQSSAVIWEKERPSQGIYTTFTDRRYCQQYQNPPSVAPFRPPISRKAV